MYRDDLAATHARLEQLQRELDDARTGKDQDKQRIALLTAQLTAAQQALQRLGGGALAHAPMFTMPPRGNTILVLGVMAIVFCQFVGPIAWAMGNEEMRRIDAGLTDPGTRSAAFAGRVCGMIATILMIVSVVAVFAIVGLIAQNP